MRRSPTRFTACLLAAFPALAAPPPGGDMAENQANAISSIKAVIVNLSVWRSLDLEENGVKDYWVRDIAALYAIDDNGKPAALIDKALARSDAAPAMKYKELEGEPTPKNGYFCKMVKMDGQGKPYVTPTAPPPKAKNLPPGPSTNASRFALCAFPARHGVDGKLTFIMCEEGPIWQKDLGPEAKGVDVWPNPAKPGSGWSPLGR